MDYAARLGTAGAWTAARKNGPSKRLGMAEGGTLVTELRKDCARVWSTPVFHVKH
jgi:hypothetical protein